MIQRKAAEERHGSQAARNGYCRGNAAGKQQNSLVRFNQNVHARPGGKCLSGAACEQPAQNRAGGHQHHGLLKQLQKKRAPVCPKRLSQTELREAAGISRQHQHHHIRARYQENQRHHAHQKAQRMFVIIAPGLDT